MGLVIQYPERKSVKHAYTISKHTCILSLSFCHFMLEISALYKYWSYFYYFFFAITTVTIVIIVVIVILIFIIVIINIIFMLNIFFSRRKILVYVTPSHKNGIITHFHLFSRSASNCVRIIIN